jgi:hypothetical protein
MTLCYVAVFFGSKRFRKINFNQIIKHFTITNPYVNVTARTVFFKPIFFIYLKFSVSFKLIFFTCLQPFVSFKFIFFTCLEPSVSFKFIFFTCLEPFVSLQYIIITLSEGY